ncbi:NAD(P)/FAD-dependent oxidoreductase [Caballeronia sp. LjRoot34]|uniref:FAD-dependent oxidoreductase n=1 Tax=Caballeronia sp. LjRoot34 TaxID=3342325 RepID=UPI003ECFDD78
MAFIPNLRRRQPIIAAGETAPASQPSFGYIDTLFDYGALLAESPDSLGKLPAAGNRTVAIIGAGISGLVSAYELLRAGASNVVLYEASGRIGGRAYSIPFTDQASAFLAELGAMRFPPSEYSLFHYLNRFGIQANSNFPDPGEVLTNLGYQGQTYTWPAQGNPPDMFATVHAGWSAFISDGFTPASGPALLAPVAITNLLRNGQLGAARSAWQAYIDMFGNIPRVRAGLMPFIDRAWIAVCLPYIRNLPESAILLIQVYLTDLHTTLKSRYCRIGYRRFWAPSL